MSDLENQGTPIVPDDLGAADEWANDSIALPGGVEQPKDDVKIDNTDDVEEETTEPAKEDETEVEYVEDPGEYVPQDYSFEVTTYDEEGNKPKVHTITSPDDWDKLLEDTPNLGSEAAVAKAMRLVSKMELKQEQDLANWQAKVDKYNEVVSADSAATERINEMQKEMDYLVDRGDLPKLTKEQIDANWNDPEVAKQDGIKEHVAVIKAAEKEMAARAKAGLSGKVSLIDAFNQMSRSSDAKKAGDEQKATKQARKDAGGKVASGAANPVTSTPKGIAVGRGGSLDDLGKNWF